MQITILAFGQIAAITGNNIVLNQQVNDTDDLRQLLQNQFPELLNLKYALAVNRQIVHENVPLANNITVALLPPFSGG